MSLQELSLTLAEKEEEINTLKSEFQEFQEMSKTIESELEEEIEDLKSIIEKLKQENSELFQKKQRTKGKTNLERFYVKVFKFRKKPCKSI